jgi:hypothetical protein
VVAGLAAIVALGLVLSRPEGRFGFLQGQKPVYVAAEKGISLYELKADFEVVAKAAREELLAVGYRDEGGPEEGPAILRDDHSRTELPHTVVILKDFRQSSPMDLRPTRGWVAISMSGTPRRRSRWERLGGLFGL